LVAKRRRLSIELLAIDHRQLAAQIAVDTGNAMIAPL
jgi:hypothetical protein